MNVFLKAAVVLLMVFAGEAQANEVMDRVVLCNRIAAGALLRMQGFGGNVKWISPEKMMEFSQAQPPKDSMYVRDDGETAAEKEEYADQLMTGWNGQDRHINSHAGQPVDPKKLLEACMKQKEANAGRFYQTASSQGLVEPFTSMERLCAFRVQIMSAALPYKQQMTVDALLEQQPFPDGWSDGMKALGRKDITELFEFVGEGRVFIQTRYQSCMGQK